MGGKRAQKGDYICHVKLHSSVEGHKVKGKRARGEIRSY